MATEIINGKFKPEYWILPSPSASKAFSTSFIRPSASFKASDIQHAPRAAFIGTLRWSILSKPLFKPTRSRKPCLSVSSFRQRFSTLESRMFCDSPSIVNRGSALSIHLVKRTYVLFPIVQWKIGVTELNSCPSSFVDVQPNGIALCNQAWLPAAGFASRWTGRKHRHGVTPYR